MAACQLALLLLTGYISVFVVTATYGFALTASHFRKAGMPAQAKVTKALLPHHSVPRLGSHARTPALLRGPPRGGLVADLVLDGTAFSLWERACSRRGRSIQHLQRLCHRLREQARSHIGSVTTYGFAGTANSCGSELARDGGGSACISVGCADVFASKLAPTLDRSPDARIRSAVRPSSRASFCSHRSDECTTERVRPALRPPRGGR
jgi:hypothetical protein